MVRFNQQRSERRTRLLAAADGKRPKGDAVVALAPRDDVAPLRVPPLDEIRSCELERGLDRLRASAYEEHMPDARRGMADKVIGKLFGDLRGEEAGVGIGEPMGAP